MKLELKNKKFKGKSAGFDFDKGVADVPEGKENDARRVARLLGYTVVEDKPKEEPKKATKKAAPKKKAAAKKTTKKADEDK